MKTFYWHDYETWGINPTIDRPSQFAGVRTDENLNIISDPLVVFCKPCEDVLPHPEACLVTGITPQRALQQGVPEAEFIQQIYAEFSQPHTCGVGYNSIRFDDEVTRYTLYRNFYDAYEREWANGNSRWDIIDMVRLVYAVRPEGIEWPMVDGKPSFRLELLTEANGISHAAAHDAYSDVEATINFARLIKQQKPALYDYVYQHKSKHAVAKLMDIKHKKPLLHISSKFSSERGCAGFIVPLAMHPKNKNAVIVYDLSEDPEPLLTLSPQEIRDRVFVSQADLPEGVNRLPIKLVHLNKCPILATTKLLDEKTSKRLGINREQCENYWQKLRYADLSAKLQAMYELDDFTPSSDPEAQLYNGFINNKDKPLMREVRKLKGAELAGAHFPFQDKRLQEMLARYKARNSFEFLHAEEQVKWTRFVKHCLVSDSDGRLTVPSIRARIGELHAEHDSNPEKRTILHALSQYVDRLAQKYSVN